MVDMFTTWDWLQSIKHEHKVIVSCYNWFVPMLAVLQGKTSSMWYVQTACDMFRLLVVCSDCSWCVQTCLPKHLFLACDMFRLLVVCSDCLWCVQTACGVFRLLVICSDCLWCVQTCLPKHLFYYHSVLC